MKKGKKVILTKISDDYFGGNHPNGIYQGHTIVGTVKDDLVIGERFTVNNFKNYLHTSRVKEIIDENTFKTEYSTYRIDYLNEDL